MDIGPFEMIVLIVLISAGAGVLRARYAAMRRGALAGRAERDQENERLRAEVKQLRDRLAVIERITVEQESSLEREFDRLRREETRP